MSNIRDVAKEAGVSTATVSRTFTSPQHGHTQTQKKVLEAARRLGYRPRQDQRSRRSGQDDLPANVSFSRPGLRDIIGFQFLAAGPNDSISSNAFYGPILLGAEKEASALGLHMLVNTTDRHAFALEVPSMVKEQMINGMLLVGSAESDDFSTIARHVPNLVLVDNPDETHRYEAIISDGFSGAYEATQYLLDLGHGDNTVFLTAQRKSKTFQERLRGYICALFENGITADSGKVVRVPPGRDDQSEQKAAITAMLQSPNRPTAIICANDYLALKVMQTCWSLGVRIPDDLSVIGFDDVEFSRQAWPPLTTVRVDKELMGRLAVRRLYARLQQGSSPANWQPVGPHIVPVSLVIRDSCAPFVKG
ncbi:MAG: LacI family DNA-binding transcriptional regulator [Fibrella sp.]|nr:LacI family DNA-binding transcriptional regulator [Armatimonadota bacterium]